MSQQINLFNPIFLKQEKYFSARTIVQAIGLLLVGGLLLGSYAGYQSVALEREAAETAKRLVHVQNELVQVTSAFAPREKSKVLEQEIQRADVELIALKQALDTLQKGELGNTSGYSGYLAAFSRQIVPGLWLTGFTIEGAGNEISIQGRALQPELVPQYINRLTREIVMRGKTFSTLEIQRPMVADDAMAEPTARNGPAPANYVEFALRSTSMSQGNDAPGVENK